MKRRKSGRKVPEREELERQFEAPSVMSARNSIMVSLRPTNS